MLVLSRKLGERIVIGNGIVVTVTDIRGDRIRLGVTAPAEVPVHRAEVFAKVHGRSSGAADMQPPLESRFFAECA